MKSVEQIPIDPFVLRYRSMNGRSPFDTSGRTLSDPTCSTYFMAISKTPRFEQKEKAAQVNEESGMKLDGKVARITGGGTGIGAAIARRFVADGAKICITGRRREMLDDLDRTLPKDQILTCPADVTVYKDIQRMADATLKFKGRAHHAHQAGRIGLWLLQDPLQCRLPGRDPDGPAGGCTAPRRNPFSMTPPASISP
jgi:hypothetical protein